MVRTNDSPAKLKTNTLINEFTNRGIFVGIDIIDSAFTQNCYDLYLCLLIFLLIFVIAEAEAIVIKYFQCGATFSYTGRC